MLEEAYGLSLLAWCPACSRHCSWRAAVVRFRRAIWLTCSKCVFIGWCELCALRSSLKQAVCKGRWARSGDAWLHFAKRQIVLSARDSRVKPQSLSGHDGLHRMFSGKLNTWLILPVVICLSQRLSHACLSISSCTAKLRMAH